MHELVIVEGILDTVIPEVKKYDVEKILSIRLKIGELSGIVESCVHEYFGIAAKGTIAEGAKIIIEKTPIREPTPAPNAAVRSLGSYPAESISWIPWKRNEFKSEIPIIFRRNQ